MIEKLKWGLVIVVSMALGAGAIAGINALDGDKPGTSTTVIERVSPSSTSGVSASLDSVADLVDQVRPSVVRVNSTGTGSLGGVGSGVVLDKNGHILTNNHVISGASQIDVALWDGTRASADVVGRDPGNDLAVIKADLPADKLRPAKLGDSDSVRVGELVIAIGNPFTIDGTVTEGIVSGLGRSLEGNGGRPLRQLIQSDAAINPGNSGGGLFNARGEVIGITTAIENPTNERVFIGIGYAVPINTATRFLPDMLAGRTIEHPRLGIRLQDLTPGIAATRGLAVDEGVLVVQVEAGSAAARAGMVGGSNGDVITAIDGTKIRNFQELASFVDSKKVGDTVKVTVVRGNNNETTLDVTLEAWRTGNS
jgi:S1-C subfamily serine protease